MRRSDLIVLPCAAGALLVHLLTNQRYGYFRDELYFIDCARAHGGAHRV